jgi:hypothetical protein
LYRRPAPASDFIFREKYRKNQKYAGGMAALILHRPTNRDTFALMRPL